MAEAGLRKKVGLSLSFAGVVVLILVLIKPAPVGANVTFDAVSSADGVRFVVAEPNAPVTDTPVDGGGPTAQAHVNSLGVSQAFSSYPYPGETVVTGPGTVAGLTGGKVSLPGYPFAVASDYPTVPSQSDQQGPYRVTASSSQGQSESSAQLGAAGGPLVVSHARTAQEGGTVVAEATSDVESLTIGPVSLARVLSSARISIASNGAVSRSSELEVTGLAVAGTTIGIGPGGLTLPGSTVPLPAGDPVRQTLARAGITMAYLAVQQQPSGVVAPGLVLSAPVKLPSGTTATVTYTLGQSSAAASSSPLEAGGTPSIVIVPPPAPSSSGSPSGPAAAPPSAPGAGPGPAGPPAESRALVSIGSPRRAPGSSGTGESATSLTRARAFDSASVFIVLAAALMVGFGSVSLFSIFGVRSRWTS